MYRFLSHSPSLLLTYLSHRDDHDQCLHIWQSVLFAIAEHPENLHTNITSLLHASHKGTLPSYLKPKTDELDALVRELLADLLNGLAKTGTMSLVSQILTTPG
jgi:hypothetical protein